MHVALFIVDLFVDQGHRFLEAVKFSPVEYHLVLNHVYSLVVKPEGVREAVLAEVPWDKDLYTLLNFLHEQLFIDFDSLEHNLKVENALGNAERS